MVQHIALYVLIGCLLSSCIMLSSEVMRNRNDPKSWGLTCMFLSIGCGTGFVYGLIHLIEKAVN